MVPPIRSANLGDCDAFDAGEGAIGMMRLVLLCLISATILSIVAEKSAQAGEKSKRPNIVWLTAENIDIDLGCYGEKLVRTPNIDRLASEGVRFTRVFATSPVCAPSRSAFMTGMYQTTTGTHHMRSHRDDGFRLPRGVRPVTHWFADAGYFTANIKLIGKHTVGTGKLDLNFVNEGRIFESDNWSVLKEKQPFFVQINTPEVEYDIYDRKTKDKRRVEWVGERDHPQIATPDKVVPPPYYPDHPIVRQEWARYLNSVSGLDQRVGHVLDALRTDGLADNTIIIFFADNGRLEARNPLLLRQRTACAYDHSLAKAFSRSGLVQGRFGQ
jgi:arylsulfatase A-like enzyme